MRGGKLGVFYESFFGGGGVAGRCFKKNYGATASLKSKIVWENIGGRGYFGWSSCSKMNGQAEKRKERP